MLRFCVLALVLLVCQTLENVKHEGAHLGSLWEKMLPYSMLAGNTNLYGGGGMAGMGGAYNSQGGLSGSTNNWPLYAAALDKMDCFDKDWCRMYLANGGMSPYGMNNPYGGSSSRSKSRSSSSSNSQSPYGNFGGRNSGVSGGNMFSGFGGSTGMGMGGMGLYDDGILDDIMDYQMLYGGGYGNVGAYGMPGMSMMGFPRGFPGVQFYGLDAGSDVGDCMDNDLCKMAMMSYSARNKNRNQGSRSSSRGDSGRGRSPSRSSPSQHSRNIGYGQNDYGMSAGGYGGGDYRKSYPSLVLGNVRYAPNHSVYGNLLTSPRYTKIIPVLNLVQ